MSQSQLYLNEYLLGNIIKRIFPDNEIIFNGQYSWLPSPRGGNLQLDIYIPELNLGIEYNGKQHYSLTRKFHDDKKDFLYRKECDALKKKLCKKNGVKLIIFTYREKLSYVSVVKKLKRTGVLS